MNTFLNKLLVFLNLGPLNIFRVFIYRLGVKIRLHPVVWLKFKLPRGIFFQEMPNKKKLPDTDFIFYAFDYIKVQESCGKLEWHYNLLSSEYFNGSDKEWFKIPDFESGDIKGIWEASRFGWVTALTKWELKYNDGRAIAKLDSWLNDWCEKNPAYFGPNWKCGQEASIRVMHIIAGLIGLNKIENINVNVVSLIECHLERIAPTINYALAQDNNHGTSEAVALYIGGAVLYNLNNNEKYLNWMKQGQKWLIDRANKLIMTDGGFSQYSVNYHRVMLDSYCLAEIIRRKLDLDPFPKKIYKQLALATEWLYILVQESGDAPNLGANDGARLIPICETTYRDFRPTVQLSSTLFCQYSYYYEAGPYDACLDYFNLEKIYNKDSIRPSKSRIFENSGLITYKDIDFFLCFKFPRFEFRPSQCDALHLDVWYRGENILRDGGTYSYNCTKDDLDYFSGVKSHNTVEFDGHLQMPRLGRFLFGAWLRPKNLQYKESVFSCGYVDYWKCEHNRKVQIQDKKIIIIDKAKGFKNQAILRWRLIPGNWSLYKNSISNGVIKLEIFCDKNFQVRLVKGEESRFYYQKSSLPVLEVIFYEEAQLTTEIKVL